MNLDCIYLAEQIGHRAVGPAKAPEFRCLRWRRGKTTLGTCCACHEYRQHTPAMTLGEPQSQVAQADAPYQQTFLNRYGSPAGLHDLYLGASCFGIMGGPSLRQMDLSPLTRRGVVVLSLNNCPGGLPAGIRPHIWVHSDPARKMHDSLWRDPGILKFTPATQWDLGKNGKNSLRFRQPDGTIHKREGVSARSMPGVIGFNRNFDFNPEVFLGEPTLCNGVSSKAAAALLWPHVVNTFFTVLKLVYFLGFRRFYLLGADFWMDAEKPYATGETKSINAARTNNEKFLEMCVMCDALQPQFLAAGFHVINCTPGSCLWSFPKMDFESAIDEATATFEEPLDTRGWYYDKDT